MRYDEIRGDIQTGDLILFSGKGHISEMIKWFSGGDWSHVGMALRIPEYDMLLLWESTTLSDIRDLDTNKMTKGVQLVPLSERVRKYDGGIGLVQLDFERTPERTQALTKLRREFRGRPYEESKLQLIRSAWDGWGGRNTEDLSSLFCSEMVAEALQAMEVIEEGLPSNEWTPQDFGEFDTFGDYLRADVSFVHDGIISIEAA